jgi:RNA-directed DNA polymerase
MLIEQIAKETGLSRAYLERLALTASHRYKLYSIPKKTGGIRLIAHPARALKSVQRWLAKSLFAPLPVHQAATAYREGIGIRENALPHLEGNFLLKLDIQDFFPSLKAADVSYLLQQNVQLLRYELSEADIVFVQRIVSRRGELPIGAPSSPVISNQLMFEFDRAISQRCDVLGVEYTRYADDLFFSTSTPNVLREIHLNVVGMLREYEHPKLKLNLAKTTYTSRRRKRIVTGVVLTSDRKLSLGRAKKREVRSLVQRYRDAELDLATAVYLSGFLSYAASVEPDFLVALRAKYGNEVVERAAHLLPNPPPVN